MNQTNKVAYELNENETCYSLAWNPEHPDLLYAGTGYNNLSFFDLRMSMLFNFTFYMIQFVCMYSINIF